MNDIKILKSNAKLSSKRKYRYTLYRRWGSIFAPSLMIIGLNPSKADEKEDDPTITRCIRFAYDLGFSSVRMMNLFSYRATDPKDMKSSKNPIGRNNDRHIKRMAYRVDRNEGRIVAAWGNHGSYLNRDKEVLELLKHYDLYCFGITKQNQPKHPLFLRADTKLKIFRSRIK